MVNPVEIEFLTLVQTFRNPVGGTLSSLHLLLQHASVKRANDITVKILDEGENELATSTAINIDQGLVSFSFNVDLEANSNNLNYLFSLS